MRKRMISVFMAMLTLFLSINFDIAEAATTPEPYKYWAVSISSYVETLGGGLSFKLGTGTNLKAANKTGVYDGYPFDISIGVEINSNATPGAEYQNFENANILTFEEYMDTTDQIPANKDADFRAQGHLTTTDGGGKSIPISNFSYVGGSRYDMDLDFPDKQTMITCLDWQDKYGTTDGTKRHYPFFVTYILEIPHEKFNPDTGEWDIESKVEALLNISQEAPAVWNYTDYDRGWSADYSVDMDASDSSSARPGEEYIYDMGVDGNYDNERLSRNNRITLTGEIYPNELSGTIRENGTFRVDGSVEVVDDNDVSDIAYDNTTVEYRIINENPKAVSKITDKGKNSEIYLYAERMINIKDLSTDPESNLMESEFRVYDGTNLIALWRFTKDTKDGAWKVDSSDKLDEYIQEMTVSASTLDSNLIFKKSGNYRVEHIVGDIKDHSIVSQRFDTKTTNINIRQAAMPPVADFEYRLNGKATDYTYPNIEVSLLDKSTDVNNDIIKWEWTKHGGTKQEGQNGVTATYAAEGKYSNTLKVTDFLGMTSTITKQIEVLPPIPKAEISMNDSESLLKKNRRVVISSEKSFAPPTDPIQWDKTKWIIEPADGQDPSSIKISSSLSDSMKKSVVFKETGKYRVVIDLENNYSAANPNHPKINIKKSEFIIEIKEDVKPDPRFNITGNSPNFQDNPISTVAKVGNTSVSPDSDYLDTFPNTGLEDANNFFGRGQNAFEMEIRKDVNEDGIFADDEIYGNYSGRSVDIPVFFKEGEGSDYQATLKVKETFGQPTIKEFVNDDDRVTNTLVKKFAINWIPDIKFDIPDWAYPDDTINFVTQIKDEKPAITNVVWSIQKRDSAGVYRIVNIESASIYSLTRNGGNIQFKESGFYILKADITDEKGQKSSYQDNIRIYPFPTAIITDNPAYRFDNKDIPEQFNAKQNRTYELFGNTSHINDSFGNGMHDIDHSKDYFEIVPMGGQPVSSIKVTDGIGGILNLTSEDGTIFKATNKQLDRTMLFKLPGTYKVRYQTTNTHGKKSPFAEQVITVHEDKTPDVSFEVIEQTFRDPEDAKQAKIVAYDIKISSPDRDNISLERVRYRFDSNNNGSFDDETWQIPGVIDKTNPSNWKIEIKKNHVGKYQVEVHAEETYGQPTIGRFVDQTGADKRTKTVVKGIEVDNQPPLADFSLLRKTKVDIVFAVGQTNPANLVELDTKINSYVKSYLNANGGDVLDTNISTIKTSGQDMQNAFTWNQHLNIDRNIGSIAFQNNGTKLQMYGNKRNAGFNKIFSSNNSDPDMLKQEMSFSYSLNFGDSFNGAGVLINTHMTGDLMNGYALFIRNNGNAEVYKLTNWTKTSAQNIMTSANATLLGSIPMGNSGNFKIESKKDLLTVYNNSNGAVIGSVALPTHYGWGIGFFSDHYSHNCSSIGQFALENLQLQMTKGKSLADALKTSSWREGALRFIVNIDDAKMSLGYYDNGTMNKDSYLKLVSLLTAENIYYIGLGTGNNVNENNTLIRDNNGKGQFYYNNSPNIDKSLQNTGQYILNIIKALPKTLTNYVLVNEWFGYKVNYTDYEGDPQYDIHDWKYDHNETYFENNLGRITEHNQWKRGTIQGGITVFDKTGKYMVEYKTKDNPVGADNRFDSYRKWSSMPNGPMAIFVHRKPLAEARFTITKNNPSMTVNFTSMAYDKDHQSEANKGIRAREWWYKEIGAVSWTSGGTGTTFSFTGNMTKDYLVKHRVQDIDGENGIGVWSDDNIILVTTQPLPPVASFEITPVTYPIKTFLNMTDFSYDPNGDKLVEYRWTLKKDGVTRLTRTLTNASGVTAAQVNTVRDAVKSTIDSLGHSAYGKWILELQVRDSSSATWGDPLATSDVISRMIEVVPNNSPPTANINPTNVFVDGRNSTDTDNLSNTLNNYINWNLAVSDPDADNKGFVYRWELEHHEGTSGILKSTSDMSSQDRITTKVYTTQQPFVNKSFESNSLAPGPYNVRLQVTDIPTYGEAKSTSVDKKFYIVPKVTGVPYVILEEGKEEIICGDTVTLRIITDEITTGITAQAEGSTATLSFVSKQGTQYIWETPFVIPEIEDSGNMDITFTLKTDFGSKDIFGTEGKTTRIKTLKETIYVTALKLDDFRVTDLVKHSQYKDLYPLRRPDFTLDYIAGYYCTFQINAKGNPERVFADVSHNTSGVGTVELKKVGDSGTYGVWEGKYFAPFDTPRNTVISFDLEARKGSTKYNYNEKESWNGETLEIKESLMKDAVISRTN